MAHETPVREAAYAETSAREASARDSLSLEAAVSEATEHAIAEHEAPPREIEDREAPALEAEDREARAREARAREAQAREAEAREAREREAREAHAREAQAREARAREAQAREAEAREAREREAREAHAREAQAREARAREVQAREAEARAREAREAEAREAEAREARAREAQAREAEARETRAREAEAREAREAQEAWEAQAREARAREAHEAAARETEAREARETLAREAQARQAQARETPVRGAAASGPPQRPSRPTPSARPQTAQPRAAQAESAQPRAAQAESAQTRASQPEAAKPEAAKPEAARPEAPRPDRPRPATIKPSRVEPGRPKLTLPEPPPTASAPPTSPAARDDAPPWSQVIATTLQLWLARRLRGGRNALAGPARRSRRWLGALGLALVVFAAGALTIALVQKNNNTGRPAAGSGGRAHTAPTSKPVKLSGPGLQAAARNRQQAAAWIAAQVSHAAIVSCDPVMCQALAAAHFPVGNLLTLGPSATDPMGSQLVVDTTVLRNQFGSRLENVYAPAVLASFGSGASGVHVRIEAPDGGAAYLVAQRADLLARQQDGQQLLGSKGLHLASGARQSIAAGEVDSRLLATLVALLGQRFPVYVYRFGDEGPGASPGVPMRMMRIAALTQSGSGASSYRHSVQRFLAQQQPPYRASVSVLHLAGAKTVIQIEFAAPSPLGLLGAHSGQ